MKYIILRNEVAVGMHHYGSKELEIGAKHTLHHEPTNPYDHKAIAIKDCSRQTVAYLSRSSARRIIKVFENELNQGPVYCKPKTPPEVRRRNLGPQQIVVVGFKCHPDDVERASALLNETGVTFSVV